MWLLLRRLASFNFGPGQIDGDFNEILECSEKKGGPFPLGIYFVMRDFYSTLDSCNLADIKATGYLFTWHNKQFGSFCIKETLNRFCAIPNWFNLHSTWHAQDLNAMNSDHASISLVFGNRNNKKMLDKNRGDRFFFKEQ